MNINIVSGKSGERCSQKIFDILASRDKTKKHIIIAPDRSLFSIEKMLFEKLNESAFFDVNVISMSRLSKSILGGCDNKKLLTKNSGVALVRKLLAENKDKLKSFRKSTEFMGFAKTIFETICLYKSCNITPSDVYTDDTQNYSNLKQCDIKLIYSLYEDYLQNEYTDSFNRLMLFSSKIDKNTFKDTVFYLMEFDDYTSIMYDIIYKLSRYSEGIYIFATYGKGSNNSNIYSNKIYYDLIGMFKAYGLEYKVLTAEDYSDKTHNHILNNLLSYNIFNVEKTKDIEVLSFDSVMDEVKYAVAKIYSITLETKLDYSNFAIYVPSISDYKTRLSREMDKYKIPYYFDESGVLSDHTLIRAFVLIWKVMLDDYVVSDFVNLLKSPLMHFGCDKLFDYDHYLKVVSASHLVTNSELLDEEIRAFVGFIEEQKTALEQVTSTNSFIEISKNIFEYITNRGQDYLEKLGELDKRVYLQVSNKFQAILDDYSLIFGALNQSPKMFFDTLSVYFDGTNIGLPPINSNTIFVASEESYLSPTPYLFVLGSNEGKQPSFKLDNGLVTDEEIARLPNADKINPTISAINGRKTFKMFENILKYKRKLFMLYPHSGADGTLYPSTMLLSLIRLFDLQTTNGSNILDLINNSSQVIDEENIVFNNLSERVLYDNLLTLKKQYHTFEGSRGYREMLNTLYSVNSSTSLKELFDGINTSPKLSATHNLFKNGRTSVSQIECYYMCPYKHFVTYGLKLKESIKQRLMPNDIGTIFHLVLKDLLPYILKNLEKENVYDLAVLKGQSLLEVVLKQEVYANMKKNPKNSIILKSMADELNRIIEAIIYNLSVTNFRPQYYEFSFNTSGYAVEGIGFTGSIDRIDTLDDKFVIVDYKTGSNDFSDFTDLYSGKKLQLLAYAKFFEDKTKLKPAGVFYLPISNKFKGDSGYKYNGVMLGEKSNIIDIDTSLINPSTTSRVINLSTKQDGEFSSNNCYKRLCLSAEEFEYLLNYSMLQVKRAIRSISQNDISTKPLSQGGRVTCDYCEYKPLCNYMGGSDRKIESVPTVEELKAKEEEKDGQL